MDTAMLLRDALGLKKPAVSITFLSAAPTQVPHVAAAGPSGCSYWKRAGEGETFYTEADDHYNCPIGAHTHGVEMPAAQMQELQGIVTTMVSLGYIRMEEVPGIPKREERFGIAVYGPLADGETPDVVLVRGNARQMMLLEEAALAAGVAGTAPLMGRPTCAAIPLAMQTGRSVSSLGCIGNRVYTELGDDEFYFALPGKHLAAVAEKLGGIVNANRELEKYHQAKVQKAEASR
jgi:uncharacterized protein (DUF169 family)